MAITPGDVYKPSETDILRVNALENTIDKTLNEKFETGKPLYFSLNGSEEFLQGNSLNNPQLTELKKRYDSWHIAQDHDRDGWYLKFSAKSN
jgi:hypothetical protein